MIREETTTGRGEARAGPQTLEDLLVRGGLASDNAYREQPERLVDDGRCVVQAAEKIRVREKLADRLLLVVTKDTVVLGTELLERFWVRLEEEPDVLIRSNVSALESLESGIRGFTERVKRTVVVSFVVPYPAMMRPLMLWLCT